MLTVTLLIFFASMKLGAQSIGVNTDGSQPNPSAMLDVKSTTKGFLTPRMTLAQRNTIASPAAGLMIFQTDNTVGYYYYNGAAWTQMGGGGASGYWSLNGSNIFNNNGGYVGIGTNTPTSQLTIQTPLNSTGFTHIAGANEIIFSEFAGGVSAGIGTSTNHALRFNTNGTGKMSIYPTGEVVVGANTTAPFGQFTVETLDNSYGINHITPSGIRIGTYVGGTSAGIGTYSNTNMRIFCNNVSAMFIAAATGNVGIGTNNPDVYKLAVNGSIRAKEVRINTGWADYVFKDDYKLKSLHDVEQFIKEHKHLPGISPAEILQNEGMDVSDMQTKMMAKIEELTLYLIEANKIIESLKQRIEIIEQRDIK